MAALLPLSAAQAADLTVDGLGVIPFKSGVAVTDGKGTAVEAMFRRNMAAGPKETKRTALLRFLTMPAGMRLDRGKEPPVAEARVYQLVRKELRGTYTMMVFVFSGEEEDLFCRNRKAAAFWERAFSAEGPDGGAMGNALTADEFRGQAEKAMEGAPGPAPDFQILDASPWKRFRNGDGTARWEQQVKVTVTNEAGLVMPMWTESVLYRNGAGRYYFLIFTGSHGSGKKFSGDILYGLYQIGRDTV